jgi:hypothetical protein
MSKNKKAVNVSDIKDDNAIVAQQKNDIKISENLEERNAIIEKIKNIKDDKRVILKITTDDLKLKKIKKKKEKKQKIVNPN